MRVWVQKFGGTSLATSEARSCAISHVKRALAEEVRLVIVVSAMGRKGAPYATDTIIEWMADNGGALPARELDLALSCGEILSATTLCSSLRLEGIDATVLTGGQAGILTDDQFGNARILTIRPQAIQELLQEGKVVIVAGFQGISPSGDVTTLGRGGSDTTATALGAALHAEFVDIFTDVDGILTADPRIVEEAQKLKRVTYAEICNMAYNGAKVIHPRAVELAMQAGVPIRVRSTFSDGQGTLVADHEHMDESGKATDRYITGIAHTQGVAQIQVTASDRAFELQLQVFKAMARNRISVDFINVTASGAVFTVRDDQSDKALKILSEIGYEAICTRECAKVSVIGGGMNGVPGIMAQIVEALTNHNIPILQSADSNTTIWVLVEGRRMEQAVQALHRQFQLHC